jgi:hypothetical protein
MSNFRIVFYQEEGDAIPDAVVVEAPTLEAAKHAVSSIYPSAVMCDDELQQLVDK